MNVEISIRGKDSKGNTEYRIIELPDMLCIGVGGRTVFNPDKPYNDIQIVLNDHDLKRLEQGEEIAPIQFKISKDKKIAWITMEMHQMAYGMEEKP